MKEGRSIVDNAKEVWPPWPDLSKSKEHAGRINFYTCPKGHRTVTVCLELGVTPFMIGCRHRECEETAQSNFYRCPPHLPVPKFGWRHPTRKEYEAADESMQNYYRDGAMMLVSLCADSDPCSPPV